MGGPGERQIELDRRRIDDRITALKKELARRSAAPAACTAPRGPHPLPGHRAGRLHQRRQVHALQPPDRRGRHGRGPPVRHPRSHHARGQAAVGRNVILSDTVGFITDLPTTLVAAFRATLEEVLEADLLVHVRAIGAALAKVYGLAAVIGRGDSEPAVELDLDVAPENLERLRALASDWPSSSGARRLRSGQAKLRRPAAPPLAARAHPVDGAGRQSVSSRGACPRSRAARRSGARP
jgi:hypothetical protein